MKFHGITMTGKFVVQKVASLPTWTVADEGRMIYNTTENKLFVGSNESWTEAGGGGGYGQPVSNFTDNDVLESGKMYFIDTSSGAMTGNLEASPSIGDNVTIVDVGGSFNTYNFTISGNGNNIHEDTSLAVDVKNTILILVWTGTSWKLDVGGIVKGTGSATQVINEHDDDFNIESGSTSYVDTSGGPITITLPDGDSIVTGTRVTIKDQYNMFGINPVTVLAINGIFENGTSSTILDSDGTNVSFVWNSGTSIWEKESVSGGVSIGEIKNISGDADADVGQFMFVNTSGGPSNITLPPSGQMISGDVISIFDQMGTFNTNNVTVTPSFGTVNGGASYIADTNNTRVDFIWENENEEWKIDIGGDLTNVIGTSGEGGGMGGSNVSSPIISNTTANINDFLIVDTSSNTIYITLPDATSLSTGDSISVYDLKGTFNTNNCTINPVNATIDGMSSFICDINKLKVDLFYVSEENEWKIDLGGVGIFGSSVGGGTGGGMTGSVPVSASNDINAGVSDFIFVNSESGPINVTLPDATYLNTGDSISVYDATGNFSDNNVTLLPTNCTIDGNSTFVCDIDKMRLDLFYNKGMNTWKMDLGGAGFFGSSVTTSESQWVMKTLDFDAIENKKYIVDTSGGSVTATLPASPTNGYSIKFSDGGNFSTNNLIIDRNFKTIEGLTNNITLDTENQSIELVYYNNNWNIA